MPRAPWLIVPALVGSLSVQAQDPLAAPSELAPWVRRVTNHAVSQRTKLQALLDATFRPVEDGGLGMVYENSRTRTVAEVWRDRKANCISLTAFFVAACHTLGMEAVYAEPTNTNRWRRSGSVIRLERHLVAMVRVPPMEDLVADFLPQLRRRAGTYIVNIVSENRVRALFHSNRAVEFLDDGDQPAALAELEIAIHADESSAAAWNIRGVVQRSQGLTAQAETSYRKALSLDPRDGTVVGNLEALMRETGRLPEAAAFRVQGLELRKKDPYFNAFLAEEAFAEGQLGEAMERIEAAIKLLPYDPDFYLTQARIRLEQGKPVDARKALELARRWALPSERQRYDSKLAAIANM